MTPTTQTTEMTNSDLNLDKVISETQNEIANNELKLEAKKTRTRKKKETLEPVKMQTVSADQHKAVMGGLLEFTGIYLSKVSKWEGFQLSKEETEILAVQASDLAVEFMPQVQSKYVKVGAFSATLIAVFGMRYMQFQEIHAQRLAESKPVSENIPHEVQTN